MRYYLLPHVNNSGFMDIYIIYDTLKKAETRSWTPLPLVFTKAIDDTRDMKRETYLHRAIASFNTIPTYDEFCQQYPELLI